MSTKVCIRCSREFEAKRSDQKFCGQLCKTYYNRGVTDNLPDTVVTDNSEQGVTDKRSVTGKCKSGCGNETKFCICHQCIKDGKTHYNLGLKCCTGASSMKPYDQWGSVCTVEEWKKNESGCDALAKTKALTELYGNFTAQELVVAGIKPPKWKERYKTKVEAIAATGEAIEEYVPKSKKIDYSTWK